MTDTAYSPQLLAAMNLLGQQPLPANAEAILASLESLAPPAESERWGDIWEAFTAAGGQFAEQIQ